MADATIPTPEDLLTFIKDFVIQQFRERGRGTHGSMLADAIRRQYPGISYEQVGFGRLADVVLKGEQQGLIYRNRQVSHLEIAPGPSSGVDTSELRSVSNSRTEFLRPELWRAFVFVAQNECHFMDRFSGRLVSIPSSDTVAVKTREADPAYVSVIAIPEEEQQSWTRTFVNDTEGLSADDAPINQSQWWLEVPQWLRKQDPSIENTWRRERSKKVVEFAQQWAKENNIPDRFLIPSPITKRASPLLNSKITDTTRQAILAAISEMPLHELENLSIPVRYLIHHFRVR